MKVSVRAKIAIADFQSNFQTSSKLRESCYVHGMKPSNFHAIGRRPGTSSFSRRDKCRSTPLPPRENHVHVCYLLQRDPLTGDALPTAGRTGNNDSEVVFSALPRLTSASSVWSRAAGMSPENEELIKLLPGKVRLVAVAAASLLFRPGGWTQVAVS